MGRPGFRDSVVSIDAPVSAVDDHVTDSYDSITCSNDVGTGLFPSFIDSEYTSWDSEEEVGPSLWPEYDSEVEVCETRLGPRQPQFGIIHKKRQPAAQRRAQKKVRFEIMEERQVEQYIRESEALAGYARFFGKYKPLAVVAATSAGIRGWSRYERRSQLMTDLDPAVVSSSASGRVEPGVHQLIRASSGVVLPEAEGGQHLGGSVVKEATREEEDRDCDDGAQSRWKGCSGGCCGIAGDRPFDLHLSEFNYSQKTKDSNCLSSATESHNNGWMELEVTVDSGACDTVMPISSCDFKILPSYASTHGIEYEVANGAEIPNLGERKCLIRTPGNRK